MGALRISAADLGLISSHAADAAPSECCGILLGRVDKQDLTVLSVLQCYNAEPTRPHVRYSIAPQELIHAEKESRRLGTEIVGFYHSHPTGDTRWSQTDLEEAHWFGCAYLIISLGSDNETYNCSLLNGKNESDKFFKKINLQVFEFAPKPQA